MKKIMISDYCMVQQKDSKNADTIIAFSAYKTPKGKFRFTHALENFEGNVIYINSAKGDDWYLEGVEGLGADYYSASTALSRLVEQYSGKGGKIITLGGSMGGYGAVLYGSLMNADYSFASGVELIQNLFIGLSDVPQKLTTPEMEKIISESRCRHHLIVGTKDPVDMINYSYFRNHPSINWYRFLNKPHTVIEYVHQKYEILDIVDKLLKDGNISFDPNDLDKEIHDFGEYIDTYMYASIPKVVSNKSFGPRKKKMLIYLYNRKEFEAIIKILADVDLKNMSTVKAIYCEALLKTGHIDKAKEVLKTLKGSKKYEKLQQLLEQKKNERRGE